MREDLEKHSLLIFRFWNVVKKQIEQEDLQVAEKVEEELVEMFRRSEEKEEVDIEVVENMEVVYVEEEVEERPLPPLHLHPRPLPGAGGQDRGNQVKAFEIPCL